MKSFTFIVPEVADQLTFTVMMKAIGINICSFGRYMRIVESDTAYCEKGECDDKVLITSYETLMRYFMEISKDLDNFWRNIFPYENP